MASLSGRSNTKTTIGQSLKYPNFYRNQILMSVAPFEMTCLSSSKALLRSARVFSSFLKLIKDVPLWLLAFTWWSNISGAFRRRSNIFVPKKVTFSLIATFWQLCWICNNKWWRRECRTIHFLSKTARINWRGSISGRTGRSIRDWSWRAAGILTSRLCSPKKRPHW